MKICIVVDNLNQKAGWGRLALKLKENLSKAGVQVGFVTQLNFGGERDVLTVPLRNFSWKSPLALFTTILKIRKFANNYDTILCFDANPYGVLVAAAIFGKKNKFVLYAIGSYSLLTSSIFRNFFIYFAYARASKVLVVSEFVKKQIEKSGLYIKHSFVQPVGVDQNFFYPTVNRPNSVSGNYIVSVGALKYRKGFHLSIDAFALVASEFPYLKYIIVGNGEDDEYAHSLYMQIKRLHLEDRVKIVGNVSDDELRSLYTFAEFFLLTPITEPNAIEGFGMVYLEAACCGITAIGNLDTGAQEAIIHGETGLLVDPNKGDIANAMRMLIKDTDYRTILSQKAKERAASFEWSRVTDQLLKTLIQ